MFVIDILSVNFNLVLKYYIVNKKIFEIEMPRRKRKGKTVKKNQSSSTGPDGDKDERTQAPHSFVIHRGKTGKYVQDLTNDVRKVMEPYTATSLKVR